MVKRFSKNETSELAKILKNDGVISVPTDTVYGVCAQICSQKAHNNLIQVKHRPKNKLFPIMCANVEQIKSIAIVNKKAECLIKKFMPGPITLVLQKQPNLPKYINNGNNTIAIRMATSKPIEELIMKTGCPIFMSSANISGEPTCKSLDEIEIVFPNLDGVMEGNVTFGKSSTIVDCTGNKIKVLREGPISLKQIIETINN